MDFDAFYLNNVQIDDARTVWLSNFFVRKYCGISDEYLSKARSLYKRSVGSTYKVCSMSYFLPEGNKSWRWGFEQGRYWYDIDSIPNHLPTKYRSRLPSKREILEQLDAIEKGPISFRASNLKNEVECWTWADDARFYKESGFGNVRIRHLLRSSAWINFIKHILKYGLYKGYGFDNQVLFLTACRNEIIKQRLGILKKPGIYELRSLVLEAPDNPDELRQFLINGAIL